MTTRRSVGFSFLPLNRLLSFSHSCLEAVTSLAAFDYYGLYHRTKSSEPKSSSSYARHCKNTQREKGCSKTIHGRARWQGERQGWRVVLKGRGRGPTLGHLPMSSSFSWTHLALCCGVSWEFFHVRGLWKGTGMGMDAVVESPKEELEHLSHQDTELCAAMGGPPQRISSICFQGRMLCFEVIARQAKCPTPFSSVSHGLRLPLRVLWKGEVII